MISIFAEAYKGKGSKYHKAMKDSKNYSAFQVKQKWEGQSGLKIP